MAKAAGRGRREKHRTSGQITQPRSLATLARSSKDRIRLPIRFRSTGFMRFQQSVVGFLPALPASGHSRAEIRGLHPGTLPTGVPPARAQAVQAPEGALGIQRAGGHLHLGAALLALLARGRGRDADQRHQEPFPFDESPPHGFSFPLIPLFGFQRIGREGYVSPSWTHQPPVGHSPRYTQS